MIYLRNGQTRILSPESCESLEVEERFANTIYAAVYRNDA